jgi:hypothetical protein
MALLKVSRSRSPRLTATRAQVGQRACDQGQVASHVSAQGVQHRPVLLGRAELTVAQQLGQVVEVAAERRQLGARCDQRGEVIASAACARQHGHTRHQTADIVAWVQTGTSSAFQRRMGLGATHAQGEPDAVASA